MSQYFKLYLKRLALALLIMTFCRMAFATIYPNTLGDSILKPFLLGLRFDFSVLAYMYLPFTILHLLPLRKIGGKWQENWLFVLFVFTTFLVVLANCIDMGYFHFTLKRSTSDLFHLFEGTGEAWSLIPQFLLSYWYVTIFGFIGIFILIFIYKKTAVEKIIEDSSWLKFMYLPLSIPFVILLARGGIQTKPITVLDASIYADNRSIPLILNTPFCLYMTAFEEQKKVPVFMSLAEAKKKYTLPEPILEGKVQKKNVVILILESFGKEYIGFYNNGKGYTPFLDSLLVQSTTFSETYANGKKSIDALPSIISGVPDLTERPLMYSNYAGNNFNSLFKIFNSYGYHTSFMHGGANGTMGFDAFCLSQGAKEYIGQNQYPLTKEHFDGKWGIFDEYFLQFSIDKMNHYPKPFFSTIFTLSSHHPYTVPEKLKGKFPKGQYDIHESIGYADYSLKLFFESIKKYDWYKNTIFVITADHTSITENPYHMNGRGVFEVPIAIFEPYKKGDSKTQMVQHIDIGPLICEKLSMEYPSKIWGNGLNKDQFFVFYQGQNYFLLENNMLLQTSDFKKYRLTNCSNDPLMTKDSSSVHLNKSNEMTLKLKSYLSQYQLSMEKNELN